MKWTRWINPVFNKLSFVLQPHHKKQHTQNSGRCGTKEGWSLLSLWPVCPQSPGICLLPGRHHSHMGINLNHTPTCQLFLLKWQMLSLFSFALIPHRCPSQLHARVERTFPVSLLIRESPSHPEMGGTQALCHKPRRCSATSQPLLFTAHGTCGSPQGPWLEVSACPWHRRMWWWWRDKWPKANMLVLLQQHLEIMQLF